MTPEWKRCDLAVAPWRVWHGLLGLLLGIVVVTVLSALSRLGPAPVAEEVTPVSGAVLQGVQFLLLVLAAVVLTWAVHRRNSRAALGLAQANVGKVAVGSVAGALLFMGAAWLYELLYLPALHSDLQVVEGFGFGQSLGQDVANLCSITVLAPLGEEFLYRGVIFRPLRDGLRRWSWAQPWPAWLPGVVAAMVSAYFFMASHGGDGQDQQLPMLYAMGLLAAAVYGWTGSLYAPILLHSLNNSAAIAMVLGQSAKAQLTTPTLYLLILAGPALAFGLTGLVQSLLPGAAASLSKSA